MEKIYNFLIEIDKLKNVYRRSYISGLTRNENSAEHSWHIALSLYVLKEEFDLDIDISRAVKMALVHDVCEIGADDISVYDPERSKKEASEREYLDMLSEMPLGFISEIKELWEDYEEQSSKESRWVKIADRLVPFMMSMNTGGKTWIEQGITKSQVKDVNSLIASEAPEIYEWMLGQMDKAVESGWLIDS